MSYINHSIVMDYRRQHATRDSRTLRVAAESPVEHEDADVNIVGEEIPIWFAIESACTPPTWRAIIDEI